MKPPVWMPMPWDLFVIFSVTTASFGISIYKMANTDSATLRGPWQEAVRAERALASIPAKVDPELVDLGCVERKLKQTLKTRQGAIRVKGKFCYLSRAAIKSFGDLQFENLSTGEGSSLRLLGDTPAFLSGELALRKGKNLIRLQWSERPEDPPRSHLTEIIEE